MSSRKILSAWRATATLGLVACAASVELVGQSVVVNPTKVEFTSADHQALLPSGEPAISKYVFQLWLAGVDPDTGAPVQETDLGKPPPVAGTTDLISVDRALTFLALPVGQEYFATVKAVGPAGDSRSDPSNLFVHLLGPNPPELVRVGPSANEIVLYARISCRRTCTAGGVSSAPRRPRQESRSRTPTSPRRRLRRRSPLP
jgi:hypothetical protein